MAVHMMLNEMRVLVNAAAHCGETSSSLNLLPRSIVPTNHLTISQYSSESVRALTMSSEHQHPFQVLLGNYDVVYCVRRRILLD